MKILVSQVSEQAVEQLRRVAVGHDVVLARTEEEIRRLRGRMAYGRLTGSTRCWRRRTTWW